MPWRFGAYELDLARRELRVDGEPRPVQPQVLAVLAYLVRNRHRVVPKEEILRELWPDAVVTDASLQRAVSLARRALRPADRKLLRTHARHGYRFVGELAEAEPDPADAAADAPPSYVRSGEVHVAYRTIGRGPLDVVLVLGWSLGMRAALELRGVSEAVRALSARARVVLFDKRGTGSSDRVKALPQLPQRVGDLEAVLDAVRSPGAVVVGFSEGGPLALTFAVTRPLRVRGLALVGAFARMAAAPDHPAGWGEAEVAALRAYIERSWGAGATMRALVPARHLTPPLRAWAARAELEGASPGAALELLEMNLGIDVRSLLSRVRTPSLVLHATGDRVVRVGNGRAVAAAIPGARLVELPGEDHAFLFGGRPTLERELLALLQRAAAPRGASLT
jgi:pimeloyl-ACP methyl ester carboxylesterase